ncbi:MAG: hypothetical protein E6J34_02160 [Chloroflexi bacterium]|nr:MAG: hypothetical protein E6J34_02160 [Chloroflexota bacterium]
MIYYRVALRSEQSSAWQWRSCTLTSVSSVLDALKAYTNVPRTAMRVLFSSSPIRMDEMLTRVNNGLSVNCVAVEQLLQGECLSLAEVKRLELELSTEGNHDSPYIFMLPANMLQVLAWTKLLARVHCGELVP